MNGPLILLFTLSIKIRTCLRCKHVRILVHQISKLTVSDYRF